MKVPAITQIATHALVFTGAACVSISGTLAGVIVRDSSPLNTTSADPTVSLDNQILFGSGILFVVSGVLSVIGGASAVVSCYLACKKPAPQPVNVEVKINPMYNPN